DRGFQRGDLGEHVLADEVVARDDADRELAVRRIGAELPEELESRAPSHPHVEQHRVRPASAELLQASAGVPGGGGFVTSRLEHPYVRSGHGLVVINNKDARHGEDYCTATVIGTAGTPVLRGR